MAKKRNNEEKKVEQLELKNDVINMQELNNIKDELKDYIDETIKNISKDEVERAYKKLIREKNKKVIVRDIIIVIMLGVIGFLLYIMYDNNYFDKFFNKEKETINEVKEENKNDENDKTSETKDDNEKEIKEVKPTLEELKSKYGSLLNYYIINETCTYKNDFYNGKLTNEIKKYLTLNTIDFTSIKEEDDYKLIQENTFKKIYDTLFNEGYESGTFDYDEHKISYLSSLAMYMLPKDIMKNETNIVREIIDIKEDNENILITTVECLFNEGKIFNVLTEEEIEDYDNQSIIKYQDKLNTVTYVFKDGKLIDLK